MRALTRCTLLAGLVIGWPVAAQQTFGGLPSGAATSAKQDAANTSLATIATALNRTSPGSSDVAALPVQGVTGGVPVAVTGTFWQATQPVSGTVTISNLPGTQAISASSLPLPTGAATAAGLTTINTTLGSPFQAGGSIGNTAFGISGTLPAFATPPTVKVSPLAAAARNFPGCTVGTSSGTCLAASTAVTYLQTQNTSATATVACSFGASAALNASGSFQLAPGQSASWGPATGGVPSGALNCIATAANTPLYVEWN